MASDVSDELERLTRQRLQQRVRAEGAEDDARRLAAGLEDIEAGHPDPRARAAEALRSDEVWGYRHELRAARAVCRLAWEHRAKLPAALRAALTAWDRVRDCSDNPAAQQFREYLTTRTG